MNAITVTVSNTLQQHTTATSLAGVAAEKVFILRNAMRVSWLAGLLARQIVLDAAVKSVTPLTSPLCPSGASQARLNSQALPNHDAERSGLRGLCYICG